MYDKVSLTTSLCSNVMLQYCIITVSFRPHVHSQFCHLRFSKLVHKNDFKSTEIRGGVRDLLRLPVTYSVVGFLETVWDLETLVGKLSQILYDYFYMATSMIVVYSVKLLWSLSQ